MIEDQFEPHIEDNVSERMKRTSGFLPPSLWCRPLLSDARPPGELWLFSHVSHFHSAQFPPTAEGARVQAPEMERSAGRPSKAYSSSYKKEYYFRDWESQCLAPINSKSLKCELHPAQSYRSVHSCSRRSGQSSNNHGSFLQWEPTHHVNVFQGNDCKFVSLTRLTIKTCLWKYNIAQILDR